MDEAAGPGQIVSFLTRWAEATPWCDWLELAGSLGRGAGDAASDVDAGLGVAVDGSSCRTRCQEALGAVRGFADVADELIQHLGTDEQPAEHLVVQYADGRQLSLVVMPAENRPGLPTGARALLDRSGRLAVAFSPSVVSADTERCREWAFLAWWAIGDVAKHAERGTVWRAVESLNEARSHAWRLRAVDAGVDYPGFGAVSVENAGLPAPDGMDRTMPSTEVESITAAARALADVLDPLTADYDVAGVREQALRRLTVAAGRRTRRFRTP